MMDQLDFTQPFDVEQVFDRDVTMEEYERWLTQFEPDEHTIIEKLTGAFRYYSLRRMNAALKRTYLAIIESAKVPHDQLRFIPVGYVAKSGSVIAYYLRKQNKIKEDLFLSSADVSVLESDSSLVPVLVDDFIGSGHQSIQVINELRNAAPEFDGQIIFASVVGLKSGISLIEKNPNVLAVSGDVITSEDLPFTPDSQLFSNSDERETALRLVQKYGARLYPQHPLGYAKSQGLIGFFYSTPNNTLPIFWSTDDGWTPLLPHGESFRDPSYLFGPPSGLSERLARRGPSRPFAQMAELDNVDIPEDMAVKIFGEFHKPTIFFVLAPILKEMGFTREGWGALLTSISRLKHLEHEQHPIRSAVIITKEGMKLDDIGMPIASSVGVVKLDEFEKVSTLAQMTDGFSGGILAGPDGKVHGAVAYLPGDGAGDWFLPPRYKLAASTSKRANALLLVFSGTGRVHVFYRGQIILSFRNATWHHHLSDFKRGLATLALRNAIAPRVLEEIVRISLNMADNGKGALITVGDHETVLEFSDKPKTAHMHVQPMVVTNTADEMMTGLMSQDGATIITDTGRIVQGMTFLRPPVGTEAYEEEGRGSKHSTAAKISKVTDAIAIAISVDGRVTIYAAGEVQLKVMG